MEEGDEGTLYYTCSCCGHRESGWRKESEEKKYDWNRTVGTGDLEHSNLESDTQKDNSQESNTQEDKAHE